MYNSRRKQLIESILSNKKFRMIGAERQIDSISLFKETPTPSLEKVLTVLEEGEYKDNQYRIIH